MKRKFDLIFGLVTGTVGFLIAGGETDTERMANTLLTEYHSGRLGRLTLEAPPEGR